MLAAVSVALAVILVSCGMRDAVPADAVGRMEPSAENPAETMLETDAEAVPEVIPEPETAPETTPETAPQTEQIPQTEQALLTEQALSEKTTDELILEAVSSMTVREKLGQMFLCAYENGVSPTETAAYGFSGYVLFASDFENQTPASIAESIGSLQTESEYGLLFAADEEGGSVVRVSKYAQFRETPFASPRTIYAQSGADGLYADAYEKGQLLASLGLNLNLAPVADISTDPANFIYDRSLGLTGDELNTALSAIVEGHRAAGIGSVMKHFPGYGAALDTHTGMASDDRTLEELEARDLIPFRAAMAGDADTSPVEAVMVSHIFVSALDETRPASVSAKVADYIRGEMGYDGVLMTDDLAMAGITDFCASGNAALEAILAGYDLLCCTNWEEQYPAVWQAVGDGTVTEERLTESVVRILKLKLRLGLWELENE